MLTRLFLASDPPAFCAVVAAAATAAAAEAEAPPPPPLPLPPPLCALTIAAAVDEVLPKEPTFVAEEIS